MQIFGGNLAKWSHLKREVADERMILKLIEILNLVTESLVNRGFQVSSFSSRGKWICVSAVFSPFNTAAFFMEWFNNCLYGVVQQLSCPWD
jgi:hypothetical protein